MLRYKTALLYVIQGVQYFVSSTIQAGIELHLKKFGNFPVFRRMNSRFLIFGRKILSMKPYTKAWFLLANFLGLPVSTFFALILKPGLPSAIDVHFLNVLGCGKHLLNVLTYRYALSEIQMATFFLFTACNKNLLYIWKDKHWWICDDLLLGLFICYTTSTTIFFYCNMCWIQHFIQ